MLKFVFIIVLTRLQFWQHKRGSHTKGITTGVHLHEPGCMPILSLLGGLNWGLALAYRTCKFPVKIHR